MSICQIGPMGNTELGLDFNKNQKAFIAILGIRYVRIRCRANMITIGTLCARRVNRAYLDIARVCSRSGLLSSIMGNKEVEAVFLYYI